MRVFELLYILYYGRGSIIVMIIQKVDTHNTLLHGHAILGGDTPSYSVFDGNNRILGLYFGPHVSLYVLR